MLLSLSDQCKDVIFGSLLGDGSLKIHKPYVNARFSFRHSTVQQGYFLWKVSQLSEISSEKSVWEQGSTEKLDGWGAVKLRYQSLATPELTIMHQLTHKGGHKNVRRAWLNLLTPRALAIWWLDDGSLVSDTRQGVFCTDSFSLEEVKILDRYMKKVWHISTTIAQVKDTQRFRLWIRSTEDLQRFLRIILPYIPVKAMLPKVLLLYKDAELQQRWISEVATATGFSESDVADAVAAKKLKWRTFSEKDIVQNSTTILTPVVHAVNDAD